MYNIGIDVGASHISACLITKQGILQDKKSILYNANGNEEDFVLKLKEIILGLDGNCINKIGIALPGDCKNGTLIVAPNMQLQNVNIVEELKNHITKDIFIENDAVCALIRRKTIWNIKKIYQCNYVNVWN